MSEKIVGKALFERDALKGYLSPENKEKKFVPTEDLMVALSFFAADVAFVESLLVAQVALGKLRQGRKNGIPYFCKT